MADDVPAVYGAWVPAPIMADDRLSSDHKLLAGRVLALTKKYGYCDASNAYLAGEFGVTKRAVQKWVSALVERGHFRREVEDGDRRLYPVFGQSEGVNSHSPPHEQSFTPPMNERSPEGKEYKASSRARTREEENSGFEDEYPAAAEALRAMDHPGGVRGTYATLQTAFLYDDLSSAMPDKSVKGLPYERRCELVARALMEMQSSGTPRFNTRALAGYIRSIKRAEETTDRNTEGGAADWIDEYKGSTAQA